MSFSVRILLAMLVVGRAILVARSRHVDPESFPSMRHIVLPLSVRSTAGVAMRSGWHERRRAVLQVDVTGNGDDQHTEDVLRGQNEYRMNATLPLHGAVKESGYFFSSIYLGSPPKKFTVIVDTGSTMTYIPCISCGSSCGPNHQKTHAFDPASSDTCEVITCLSPKCRCGAPACACSPENNECMYSRTYVEDSSSTGIMIEDELHVYGAPGTNDPRVSGPRVRFGCETRETGEIFKQEVDGLLGLGNSEDNIIRQLGLAQFSLCFGLVEGEGALVLGESPALEDGSVRGRMMYTPLVDRVGSSERFHDSSYDSNYQPYYAVMMERVRVGGAGGEDVLDTEGDAGDSRSQRMRRVVLDSGTTFSYMPSEVFEVFAVAVSTHAISRGLYSVPGPDPTFEDICFGGAGTHDDLDALESVFPKVTLTFEGGVDLELAPLQYLFVHTFDSGKYCLGVFDNGKDEGFLLGGITFRNILVTYDLENNRVGFGKASCRELGLKYRPPCSYFQGSAEGREMAIAAGDCLDDYFDNDIEDAVDVDEAYEDSFEADTSAAYESSDVVYDSRISSEKDYLSTDKLSGESEWLQQEEQQPALSYDDDWVFGLTRSENLSMVLWILLGLLMAVSICGTIVLATRKTMQILMMARYARVDPDWGSDHKDDDNDKPRCSSGQLVPARKSTESRTVSSHLCSPTSATVGLSSV